MDIATLKKTYAKGDFVVYTYLRCDDGIKHTCSVIGVTDDGWVMDTNYGTCLSQSFRPSDVLIWEHGKDKGKGKK